jgi:hypothetical protein
MALSSCLEDFLFFLFWQFSFFGGLSEVQGDGKAAKFVCQSDLSG